MPQGRMELLMQRFLTSVVMVGLGLVVASASQTIVGNTSSKDPKVNMPASSSENAPAVMPYAAKDNGPATGLPIIPLAKDSGKVPQNQAITVVPGPSAAPDVDKKSLTTQDQKKTVGAIDPPAVQPLAPPAALSSSLEVGKAPVVAQGDPKAVVTVTPPVALQPVAPPAGPSITPKVGEEP